MSITIYKKSISLFNLKKFKKVVILKNINLTFEAGNIIMILGDSGIGKTTLFKKITDQLTDKKISLIEQNYFDTLNPHRLVRNILFDFYDGNLSNKAIKKILTIFKLHDILDQKVSKCSGGQKERIGILRMFLNSKKNIFLLDEPLAPLDYFSKLKILNFFKLIKSIRKDITILFTSHDIFVSTKFVDKIYLLKKDGLLLLDKNEFKDFDSIHEFFFKDEKFVKLFSNFHFKLGMDIIKFMIENL